MKILLASHGTFSEGAQCFLKLMTGTETPVYTLSAFMDDRSIEQLVTEKLKEIGDFDQLLIFCDIHGGSVAQELFRQTHEDTRNIQIIAGYNLAIVMDLIFKNHIVTPEEIRHSIAEGSKAIVYLNDIKADSEEESLF